ncbi:MAG: GntR family transcriptional regulator [Proteobacteria bacterium]|nr:GntR family transcriptional regulator [Pseudomonadota bacterium]
MNDNVSETLHLLRTQSLTTVTYTELEKMILVGDLAPGTWVNEKEIAARLSMSRSPIREAFRRLEQAGLVEIVVNRGVFVRKLDRKRATELAQIRVALVGLAGRLAAARITDSELARLSNILALMEAAAKKRDHEGFYAHNATFHEEIFVYSGSERLREICHSVEKELALCRLIGRQIHLDDDDSLPQATADHRSIVESLESRDPTAAARACEEHCAWGNSRVLSVFTEAPSDQEPGKPKLLPSTGQI